MSDEKADDDPDQEGAPARAPLPVTEGPDERARRAEERLAEVLSAYRKLKSDHDGYRERITRNLERRFDQRRERLLLRFIEILDNLDRALEAAERIYVGNTVIDGLILVRTQLLQTLQEEGLERIPVVGLPYDPAVSEAVELQAVDDPEQHHVVLKDLQRGYRLNSRVARASKVLVGEYTAAAATVPADAPTEKPEGAPQLESQPRKGESGRFEEITLQDLAESQAAAVHEGAASATELEEDASLEEIVARARAREALLPSATPQAPEPPKKEDEE